MEAPIPNIAAIASRLAGETAAAFKSAPDDLEARKRILFDLRQESVKKGAIALDMDPENPYVKTVAEKLPPYQWHSFYKTRMAFIPLALAVLIGWLAGGLISAILNFMALGGDILRPVCILLAIWLEDCLASNPRARKIMLTALGLGGLARLAQALGAGLLRFGSLGSIRGLIFGNAAKTGFFKSLWLWFGAVFLIAFFAKKNAGFDYAAFEDSLREQIQEQLALSMFILEEIGKRDKEIFYLREKTSHKNASSGQNGLLADAVITVLPNLNDDIGSFLRDALQKSGFELVDGNADIIIWDASKHQELYDALGLVRNGDKCKILQNPLKTRDKLQKGLVQRLPR